MEKGKQIRNEIEIAASPEQVWQRLIDVSRYGEWNPFLIRVEGQVKAGLQLELTMAPPGEALRQKKVLITTMEPKHEFSWKGTKAHPLILSGLNRFMLSPLDGNRTRLIQEETFSGLLVPFCSSWLDRCLSVGYNNMLIALKAAAEE